MHSCRKFSDVFGHTSGRSSIVTRPRGVWSAATSRKTFMSSSSFGDAFVVVSFFSRCDDRHNTNNGEKIFFSCSQMRHILAAAWCLSLPLQKTPGRKSLTTTTTTTTTRVRIVDIQQQIIIIIIIIMGKNVRKTKKFALTKRLLNPKDAKQQSRNDGTKKAPLKNQFKTKENELKIKRIEAVTSNMFNEHNAAIKPPYSVLVDTNFINFSIKNKIDLVKGMMDCLYENCVPHVTDCVSGELEKLGTKFRVALRVAKDPRFVKLPCMHKGTYADDCIVDRQENTDVTSSPRAIRI